MKQSYSFKEITSSYVPEKKAADGPWTRFVLRPLSFPFAKIFLSLGLSPNGVSYISTVLSMAGFFLLAFGGVPLAYLGFFFFFLFGILDCADGNMARTIRRRNGIGEGSPYGEWVDAVSGYVAYAAFFLGIGGAEARLPAETASASAFPRLLPGGAFWTLTAGAALAGNLLMRLAFQSYRAAVPAGEARSKTGRERKFSESAGITGFLVPLSAAAYAFGCLRIVIALYAVIYCGGFFFIMLKIMKDMKKNTERMGP
ncbi:MAG: CDP-alcohol phosphatidyltransferase family protein [Treponema sp.]|jgi:phosphatidylglycerophosphate synthase|nr:CDP-alcohol phosphatidyltransferase family protein [Treponema sp.]